MLEQGNNAFHLIHLYTKERDGGVDVELQLYSAAGAVGIQRPFPRSILNPVFLPKQTVLVVVTGESSGIKVKQVLEEDEENAERLSKHVCQW